MSSIKVLIKAPFQQGQRKSGVEKGCEILEESVLNNFDILFTETVNPSITSICTKNWQHDYEKLYSCLLTFKVPYILLGGDHSIGMSSVACSIGKTSDVNNLYVIWIDAHADANTMEASITKNIHGQPLAGILGYEEPWFPIKCKLPTTNLLYFGIRDLDEFEVLKIKEHNIFNTRDSNIMLEKLSAITHENPNAVFHVSFDVDALDSSIMKTTGCVVDQGLFPNDVASVFNAIKDKIIAFDLVEFNPELGEEHDVLTGLNAVEQILRSVSSI